MVLVLKFSSRYVSRALGQSPFDFVEPSQQETIVGFGEVLIDQRFQDLNRPFAVLNGLLRIQH